MKRFTVLAAAILLAFTTTNAHADSVQDEAADALFKQGVAAAEQGDLAGAVTKFKASLEYKRSVGAYMNLGRIYERPGETQDLLAAHRVYELAADLAATKQDAREGAARAAAKQLETKLGAVRIVVSPDGARNVRVTIDDVPVASETLARPIWLRPGRYAVVASADGFASARETKDVAAGAEVAFTFELAPIAVDKPPEPPPPASGSNPLRVSAYVAGGVGLATLATGAVVGIVAIGKKSSFADDAQNRRFATQADYESARGSVDATAAIATVLVVAGAALTGGSAAILLLTPSASHDAIGVRLRATF
ncbi:MAG TPA: hypothetical protein VIF62_39545 [Labilithrix sp.]|jgi:hypothetical protein